jgi:hypothetical protein
VSADDRVANFHRVVDDQPPPGRRVGRRLRG